jgi:hypothetical protein
MDLTTTPLDVMSLDEAQRAQFRLVSVISRHLSGKELLTMGDLGMSGNDGRPVVTSRAEAALADYFGADAAVLVRGGGTGALRSACFAAFEPGGTVIVHRAPVYETTAVTLRAMGVRLHKFDFNDIRQHEGSHAVEPHGALVGHARQLTEDAYELGHVIAALRRIAGSIPIVIDDNYAVLKTPRIGVELGADLSTFSMFKLLGPEGVGVVIGRSDLVDRIRQDNRSGGCQVQGHEALDALRGMVYVPVAAAVQQQVATEVEKAVRAGDVDGAVNAVAANNAETIVLVQLERPRAREVIDAAGALGAATHPVGAESKYEIAPLFCRISKALSVARPDWVDWVVRINPNRAGTEQVLDILRGAIANTGEN